MASVLLFWLWSDFDLLPHLVIYDHIQICLCTPFYIKILAYIAKLVLCENGSQLRFLSPQNLHTLSEIEQVYKSLTLPSQVSYSSHAFSMTCTYCHIVLRQIFLLHHSNTDCISKNHEHLSFLFPEFHNYPPHIFPPNNISSSGTSSTKIPSYTKR